MSAPSFVRRWGVARRCCAAPPRRPTRALRQGADVVVATPGRLNDFLEPPPGFTAPVSAVKASYVVLDEADRMLDMGFEPQIKKIFKLCPSARQTVMFTATWPKAVQKIADSFTTNPIRIQIGSGGDKLTANKSITQSVEVLEEEEKWERSSPFSKGARQERHVHHVRRHESDDAISWIDD